MENGEGHHWICGGLYSLLRELGEGVDAGFVVDDFLVGNCD